MNWRRRVRTLDWDAIGGVVAALVAVVLNLLNVVEESLLIVITTSLVGLLFIRSLRQEVRYDELAETTAHTDRTVEEIRAAVTPPELELLGPETLRQQAREFGRSARGETVWFNLCLLMFARQETFDVLLRPAIENPAVTSIQFVLDEVQRERWRRDVYPKIEACDGSDSVEEPLWRDLDESVAFVLATTGDERPTALVSFWGEPFMTETIGRDVTRYVIHAKARSELVSHLRELERRYRLQPD